MLFHCKQGYKYVTRIFMFLHKFYESMPQEGGGREADEI
jgi:hypothetical protein